jgi:methionyl-tRNA synthetase
VTYVWFDALINYVSALQFRGKGSFRDFWPKANHLVAKDILKPHGIYWPTMLMAAGLPLYESLHVHGYWVMDSGKMSKSLGNVIRPLEMKDRFGMDSFRYFLLRDMVFGQDASFSMDAFVTRVNADLANNLGNLVSRVLAMGNKYFDGVVQPLGNSWAEEDLALKEAFVRTRREIEEQMEKFYFHRALESIWGNLDRTNQYIVKTSPFVLIKDPQKRPRVGEVLHHLFEALRHSADFLSPFLPETAGEISSLLGIPEDRTTDRTAWGEYFQSAHRVNPPKVLFPRIEPEEKESGN